MTETLRARRIIVTAGASGIGAAIARRCAQEGSAVHVLDLDGAAISRLTADGAIAGSTADSGDRESLLAGLDRAMEQLGGIDVLVNNAGIGGPRAAFEDISFEDWQRSLDVNVSGAFLAMQRVVPAMKAQGSGVILNISTTAARTGLLQRTPYVVSKIALRGLTLNGARELGAQGIRVNSILPGLIDNPRGRRLLELAADRQGVSVERVTKDAKAYISMRSIIDPTEIADLVVFLASDAAKHITGQEISVDGNLEWDE